jgi:hypothetical protein
MAGQQGIDLRLDTRIAWAGVFRMRRGSVVLLQVWNLRSLDIVA